MLDLEGDGFINTLDSRIKACRRSALYLDRANGNMGRGLQVLEKYFRILSSLTWDQPLMFIISEFFDKTEW